MSARFASEKGRCVGFQGHPGSRWLAQLAAILLGLTASAWGQVQGLQQDSGGSHAKGPGVRRGAEAARPAAESVARGKVPPPEILLLGSDAQELARALAKVEFGGGRVLTIVDHRIAWAMFADWGAVDDLRAMGISVATNAEEAEELAATRADPTAAAVARSFAQAVGVGREAFSGYDPEHPLINDAWDAGPLSRAAYLDNLTRAGLDLPNPLASDRSVGVGGNSDDMTGTVTVAVMFVESDGTIDTNTYTWTTAHEDNILASISSGLAWWAARAPKHAGSVSFNVVSYRHTDARVQQGYEPVSRPSMDAPLWVSAVMADFGYTSGDHLARVTAFNTWLRSNQNTDWAYTAFVCYNPSPAPNQYTDGYAAWAYLGGPYTNLLYRSFNWPFNQVFTHETGHIFQACDEYYQAGYGGCTSCSLCSTGDGHLSHGVDNGNCEYCNPAAVDCMMRVNSWTLCTYTPGHLGWAWGEDHAGYHTPWLVNRHGNDHCWISGEYREPFGNHGIRMSEGNGACWVRYCFTLPHPPTGTNSENFVREGSLKVGLELAVWGWPFDGPDLHIWNWDTSSFDNITMNCGNDDALIWEWWTVTPSNPHVSDNGEVWVQVYVDGIFDVVLDDVRVIFEAGAESIASATRTTRDDCCGDGQPDGVDVTVDANVGQAGDGATVDVTAVATLKTAAGAVVDMATATWTITDCQSDPHTLALSACGNANGSYTVHVDLKDEAGNVEDQVDLPAVSLYPTCPETITTPNTPTGPTSLEVGETGTYTTGGSVSNFGHPVE
jgi:hypothetical protein